MARGRPATAIVHRVVRAPGPVRLELEALTTWRDVHGERFGDGDPEVATVADGFTFEDVYRVRGPAFAPGGAWYRGVRATGRKRPAAWAPSEDLWFAGRFVADLQAGETAEVTAWADDVADLPLPAATIVAAAKERAGEVARRGRRRSDRCRRLAARDRRRSAGRRRADRRRRLPVVRRLVARHDDLVRGAVPRHRPGRRRPGAAAAGGGDAVRGHAGQHRRRRGHGVQHRRRHALVPARAGPPRGRHRRPRPGRRAGRRAAAASSTATSPAPASASGSTRATVC